MEAENKVAIVVIKTAQRIANVLHGIDALNAEGVFELIDMLQGDVPGVSDLVIWEALGYGTMYRMFNIVSSNEDSGGVILAKIDHDALRAVIEDRMVRSSDDMLRHLTRGAQHVRDYLAAL